MEPKNEDEIELLNRLLERLHLAGAEKHSSIEINIYKPGSQHVDRVENQYIGYTAPRCAPTRSGELPDVLSTEAAMSLWQKVQQAGYVDENYQPTISRTQSALLADAMAERLGIREKWKVFESLWNRKNMYRDYYKALDLQQSLAFQERLKALFR